PEEVEDMIMNARVAAGWITQEELEAQRAAQAQAEAEAEAAALAEAEGETLGEDALAAPAADSDAGVSAL
ncbi:MAG: hypothetical protein VW981_00415, partial [Rhodobiaceae bacterium]